MPTAPDRTYVCSKCATTAVGSEGALPTDWIYGFETRPKIAAANATKALSPFFLVFCTGTCADEKEAELP
jgi:hypothetical protein